MLKRIIPFVAFSVCVSLSASVEALTCNEFCQQPGQYCNGSNTNIPSQCVPPYNDTNGFCNQISHGVSVQDAIGNC